MNPDTHFRQSRQARRASAFAAAVAFLTSLPIPAHAANITSTWIGTSGDWLDPANWSAGIPANDLANSYRPIVNSGTLTLNTSLTTSGLYLAAPSLLTITSNNTYVVNPTFSGANSILGQVILQSGALLDVHDKIVLDNATISGDGTYRQLGGSLTVTGNITVPNFVLDGGASLLGQPLSNYSLTITNHADFLNFSNLTSKIVLNQGATLHFNFTGSSSPVGSILDLAGVTTLSSGRLNGATYINSGTLNLIGSICAPAAFNNSGTVNLSSATLDLTTAASVNIAGNITLDATSSIRAAAATLNNASISGPGAYQQISGNLLVSGPSFIEYFTLNAGASLAGSTLTISGHADFISTSVTAQKVLLLPNASLDFATPAASQPLSGNYDLRGLTTFSGQTSFLRGTSSLTNSGTLAISGLASTQLTSVALTFFNNTGTVSIQNAILDLSMAVGTLTGDFALGPNSTLQPGGSTVFLNANLHGDGLLYGINSTFRYSGETFIQNARLAAVSNSAPNSTLHFTGSASVIAGALTGNIQVDPAASLVITGSSSFGSGTFNNYATVALGTDLAGNFSSGFFTLSGNFVNHDTLLVETNIVGGSPNSITNNGLITNHTASLSLQRSISAPIINNGTIAGGFIISGTNYGLLTPDAGPFARTLTLSGGFTLAQGSRLTSANGGMILSQSSLFISGAATADHFTFASLAGTGSLTLLGNNSWNGGTASGPQLIVTDDSALLISASTTLSAGTLTNDGALFVGYWPETARSFSANLALSSSGAKIINNGTIGLDSGITGPGSLTNNGLITIANPERVSLIPLSVPFLNAGTITGGIIISANGSHSGLLTPDVGTTGKTLTLAVVQTLLDGARISSAYNGLTTTNSSTTLAGNATADHFSFNALAGTGTLTLLSNNTWNGGNLGVNVTLRVSDNATLAIPGNINPASGSILNDGTVFLGTSSSYNYTFTFGTGNRGFVNNGTLLLDNSIAGAGTLTNNGLITRNFSGASARTISSILINNATLSSYLDNTTQSGVIALTGNVYNYGLITGSVTIGAIYPATNFLYNAGTITAPASITCSGSSSGLFTGDNPLRPGTLTIAGAHSLTAGARLLSTSGSINATGTLTLLDDIPANRLTFKNLAGTGTLSLQGTNCFDGGFIAGPAVLVPNDGTLVLTASATIYAGRIINEGSFLQGLGKTLTLAASATSFLNNGNFYIDADILGPGTLTNNALLAPSNTFSSTIRTISAPLNNAGTITGPFYLSGPLFNAGTITAPSFGSLTLSGNSGSSSGLISADAPNGGKIIVIGNSYNPGFHLLDGARLSSSAGTVHVNATLIVLANAYADHLFFANLAGAGSLHITGPASWYSGSSSVNLLHVAPTGLLTLSSTTLNAGTLLNEGTILPASSTVSLTLYGTLDNRGTFTIPRNGIYNSGTIRNSGLLFNASSSANLLSLSFHNTGTFSSNGNNIVISGSGTSCSYIASATSSTITFTSNTTLNNATLAGPGIFTGILNLLGSNSVSNARFSGISGPGSLDIIDSFSASTPLNNVYLSNTQLRLLPTVASTTSFRSLTLDNASLINQSPSISFYGTLTLLNTSSLLNQGTLTIPRNQMLFNNATAGGLFSNSSLLIIESGAYLDLGRAAFTNSGTIALAGNLIINNATLSGTILASGSPYLGNSSGAGSCIFLDNASFQGASTRLVGNFSISHHVSAESLDISSASLSGPGSLTVSHALTLGYGIITNTSILSLGNILTPSGNLHHRLANAATLTNAGTFAVEFAWNYAMNFDSDGHTANAFINTGSISFASDYLTFNVPFYNTGTLNLFNNSHTLTLNGGGSASGYANVGTCLLNSPYTLTNASLAGLVYVSAPLTLRGSNSLSYIDLQHNLLGTGALANSALRWKGGTVANAGGILVNNIANISTGVYGSSATVFASMAIVDSFLFPAKVLDGANLSIQPGSSAAWGTYDFGRGARSYDSLAFHNGAQILNHGFFFTFIPAPTFSNADNHTGNAFINTGTFGRSSLTNTTTLNNTTTFLIPFHNAGIVDIQQGMIDFAGGYFNDSPITPNTADFLFAQNTALFFSGGTYDFGAEPFDLGLGGLAGTGTVRGNFTSAGTIAPGNSPGTLTITGSLALAPAATTTLQIDAADPANPLADLLIIDGFFFVNGTLNISLLNLPPNPSDLPADLPISPLSLISATTFLGTFTNAPDHSRLTDSTGTATFLITYTPTSLILSDFQSLPIPEPASLLLLAPTLLLLRRRRK